MTWAPMYWVAIRNNMGGSLDKYAIALRNEGATYDNDHGTYYKGRDIVYLI